jgi:hypothetical protein
MMALKAWQNPENLKLLLNNSAEGKYSHEFEIGK